MVAAEIFRASRLYCAAEPGHEVVDQDRDLLPPLPERRDRDRHDVEPVVEVLAEEARRHDREQVLVGRRDQPGVGGDDLAATYPEELPILEHVEELGLEPERHLADLVQQEGPPVGQLELARLAAMGPREGALLVTEQLGLEQVAGQGSAVDLEERLVPAVRDVVDGAGHHLLAGTALTLQEDGGVGVGGPPDDVLHDPHALAVPEEKVEVQSRLADGPAVAPWGVRTAGAVALGQGRLEDVLAA